VEDWLTTPFCIFFFFLIPLMFHLIPRSTSNEHVTSPNQATADISAETALSGLSENHSDSTVSTPTQGPKTSWVWNHFKPAKDSEKVICTVTLKNGELCKTELKRAKDRSTKSMIDHLLRIHQIIDPKKKDPNQACITNIFKHQRVTNEVRVYLLHFLDKYNLLTPLF